MRSKLLRILLVIVLLGAIVPAFSIVSGHQFVSASPADAYWVGNTGNWSDATNHWANVSGGLPYSTNLPINTTNVHFDNLSFTAGSQVVTVDGEISCLNIDFTGATNSPSLVVPAGVARLYVYGTSVTFIAAMTFTSTLEHFQLKPTGANTLSLTTNGLVLTGGFQIYTAAGTVLLLDNLSTGTSQIRPDYGTFNTNGKTVTCGAFYPTLNKVRTITLGASTINCTSWDLSTGTNTLTANVAAVINCSGNFAGGSIITYPIVNLTGATSTVSGNNTFATLALPSGTTQTITFTDGTTQTVGNASLSGSSGHVHTLKGSSTAGWTINKSGGGTVENNYLTLNYSAGTPANTWYYYCNTTTIQSGVTGWLGHLYTLTYTAGGNGSISGSTPQSISCGSNGSLVTGVPNAHYHFVNWSDSVATASRTDLNISGDISVTANFAINTSTVTYNAGANGTVNGSWPQNVDYGSDSNWVLATANACYHFVNWSDSSTTNPRHETNVTSNLSFLANFAINTSTITYSAGANGTLNNSIPQTINCGTNTTYVLATGNACYHFVNWSDASTMNPRTDIGTSTNQSFTANFAVDIKTVTYTNGSGGTVNGSWPQNVNCGSDGNWVLATANACYRFVNWSDTSTTNPRHEVNVTSNLSFTANFAVNTSIITYIAGANGTINGTASQTVNCGSNSTPVTATPNACYHFTSWSDANVSAARTDIGTSTNQSFTASFAINTSTLTLTSTAGGDVTTPIEGTYTYNCGQVVNLVATHYIGYTFVNWTGDTGNVANSSASTTTVTINSTNISLQANFLSITNLEPPTNLVVTQSSSCMNVSWVMGINSTTTLVVLYEDTTLSTCDVPNVSGSYIVLLNGSGTSLASDYCGIDTSQHTYQVVAWGGDGAGNFSAGCIKGTIGGNSMVTLIYMGIGIFLALFFMVISFWQRQWWLFITAGIIWFILMAFTFTQYTTADMMYWFGFVYLIMAIICIGCVFWFREKHEPIIEPEETQDEKREKRSKKLSGLRNLSHKISGRD